MQNATLLGKHSNASTTAQLVTQHASICSFIAAARLAAPPWKALRLVGAIAVLPLLGLLPFSTAAAVASDAVWSWLS